MFLLEVEESVKSSPHITLSHSILYVTTIFFAGKINFKVLSVLQLIDILYVTLFVVLLFELISNLYKFPLTLVTSISVCPFNTNGFSEDLIYIDLVF